MNQTIIMVSHEQWHREYFNRAILLHDGRVAEELPPLPTDSKKN